MAYNFMANKVDYVVHASILCSLLIDIVVIMNGLNAHGTFKIDAR